MKCDIKQQDLKRFDFHFVKSAIHNFKWVKIIQIE